MAGEFVEFLVVFYLKGVGLIMQSQRLGGPSFWTILACLFFKRNELVPIIASGHDVVISNYFQPSTLNKAQRKIDTMFAFLVFDQMSQLLSNMHFIF